MESGAVAWLILAINRSRGVGPLFDAVTKSGRMVTSALHLPTSANEMFSDDTCVVVNGSASDLERLSRHRPWKALAWCDAERFSCQSYYPFLSGLLLQEPSLLLTAEELTNNMESVFAQFGTEQRIFVRPNAHDKPFDGVLFSSVQRARGVNIVLFPEKGLLTDEPADAFRVKYVDDSVRLVSTTAIRYAHQDLRVTIDGDGEPWVDDGLGSATDDDWD